MKFEFAKATDITVFAKKHFGDMYSEYRKIFIIPDSVNYHLLRVLEGFGEDYEKQEGKFILEVQLFYKLKGETINSVNKLKRILEKDDGGNWSYYVYDSYEAVIERIDGGHGINY